MRWRAGGGEAHQLTWPCSQAPERRLLLGQRRRKTSRPSWPGAPPRGVSKSCRPAHGAGTGTDTGTDTRHWSRHWSRQGCGRRQDHRTRGPLSSCTQDRSQGRSQQEIIHHTPCGHVTVQTESAALCDACVLAAITANDVDLQLQCSQRHTNPLVVNSRSSNKLPSILTILTTAKAKVHITVKGRPRALTPH